MATANHSSAAATALGSCLIVALAGCANAATPTGQHGTDSPTLGDVFTVPASTISSTISAAGSASVGPAGTATASDRTTQTSPASSSSPSKSIIASSIVQLTEADSGRVITVRVGTRIELHLEPNGGSYDPPSVDQPAVLREDAHSGGYPSDTSATAQFTAVERGTARLTSQTDMACLHTSPACLPSQREFDITVSIH